MNCPYQEKCGGCLWRHLSLEAYKEEKVTQVKKILSGLNCSDYQMQEPFFLGDGQRRRASLAFKYKKGTLELGFNQKQSNEIVNLQSCLLLTSKINANLENIRRLVSELCAVKIPQRKKNKIIGYQNLSAGDVWITEADNGLDVVLEFDAELTLDYRMIISEQGNAASDIIRISHRRKADAKSETILEKVKPYIDIAGYHVLIPAGTFLQAGKASETAMINLVKKYIGADEGKIADLFCGVGTFSYPLSVNKNNQITAIDSSAELLEGFKQSVNANMIPNIKIITKNLFKYPLDEKELAEFDIIVFDPPRAGALAQVQKIVAAAKQPHKIVSVSCNPHSFVRDANILIEGGYHLQEITLIDQFSYSNHSELVALFTK